MSDNFLIDTPELHEALKHLEDARVILVREGKYENLEQLGDWCPVHYTRKLEAERDLLKKRVQELEGQRDAYLTALQKIITNDTGKARNIGQYFYQDLLNNAKKTASQAIVRSRPSDICIHDTDGDGKCLLHPKGCLRALCVEELRK